MAHDNVRRRMSADQLISFVGNSARQAASPKVALPVITVPGAISFHINGEEVHAFHVPAAHTDGDLIVHFKGGDIVHMGDVFFNGSYPFIDAGSGGSPLGMIAAFDRVLALVGEKTQDHPRPRPAGRQGRTATHARHAGHAGGAHPGRTPRRQERRADSRGPARRPISTPPGAGFHQARQFVQLVLGAIPR